MKKLFECANNMLRTAIGKDLALIKFCLCAMGMMIRSVHSQGEKEVSTYSGCNCIYRHIHSIDDKIYKDCSKVIKS